MIYMFDFNENTDTVIFLTAVFELSDDTVESTTMYFFYCNCKIALPRTMLYFDRIKCCKYTMKWCDRQG